MTTIRPGEQFPIVWQVADPADVTIYYPQAVIRNSRTGATLQTVSLSSAGGGRYAANYQVPQDSSGLGLYIDIEITVYTDSGHTTASGSYSKENRVYKALNTAFGTGAGGGGVDYAAIERIVERLLNKAIENLPAPVARPHIYLTEVLDAIKSLPAPASLEGLATAEHVQSVHGKVAETHGALTQSLKDFTASIESFKDFLTALADHVGSVSGEFRGSQGSFHEKMDQLMTDLRRTLDTYEKKVDGNVAKRIEDLLGNVETVFYRQGQPESKRKTFNVKALLS